MRLPVLTAIALVLGTAGCAAELRIEKMHLDLARQLARNRDEEAGKQEARMMGLAARSWGATSADYRELQCQLADTYAGWKRTGHADGLALDALGAFRDAAGESDPQLVPALLPLARSRLCASDWKAAELVTDRLDEICRPQSARADPLSPCASAALEINYLFVMEGAYRKSAATFVWMNEQRLVPPDAITRESMLTALGRQYAEGGFYPEAAWYLQRCVDEGARRFGAGPQRPGTFWRSGAGDVELEYVESAHAFQSHEPKCLEDLIELRRKTGAEAEAVRLEQWRGRLWSAGRDRSAELESRVRRTDEMQRDDLDTAWALRTLGYYYARKGLAGKAARAYSQAVQRVDRLKLNDYRRGSCPYGLRVLDALLGLGEALAADGRLAEAEGAYRRADEIAMRELNPWHKWRLDTIAGIARVRMERKDAEGAIAAWETYLDRAQQMRGEDHADFACGLSGLAQAEALAGRPRDAEARMVRANSIWSGYSRSITAIPEMPLPASLLSSRPTAN